MTHEHAEADTPDPTATPPAQLLEVTAGYPGVTALEGVTLGLHPGRITALLGANGSGKSTLFSTLLGLVTPRSGTVEIFGRSPHRARRDNLVSFVPQHEAIDMTFPVSVEQVVTMGRYPHMGLTRRPRAADRKAVEDALAATGLDTYRRRGIGELSGGQRKRAFTARALAQDAPLMLLDEPFAGVDRTSERLLTDVLHRLRETGTSILVSTHHLDGVKDLADDVVLLHRRVLASGSPDEVLTEHNMARAFGAVIAEAG
ncbi:metal ABC transporter ATP-binding protein [Nesterenkonia alba]|uniref:metal ABC transporter ATP-binding protein n=1 Tax=Nesterenkonia alba TaxID=515814 RepID=UPI0003B49DF9|nr:metal ABC transporter ATP-binding protein [Nesterenkonia alba]